MNSQMNWKSWQLAQNKAAKIVPYIPIFAKHPIAKFLRKASDMVFHVQEKFPWNDLAQFFLQTSKKVDLQVKCPYCHKDVPLAVIEELKTYCWDCSDMGQDPRS